MSFFFHRKYNYYAFGLEVNLELCVFTRIFKINRELNFAENISSPDELYPSNKKYFFFDIIREIHSTVCKVKGPA